MRFQSLSFLSYFLASVYAHSIITDPPPRAIGKSSLSACGQDITSLLEKDNQTSIDTLQIAAATSQGFNATECDLRLCKGLKLDDNLHNVQNWVEGQEVTIKVWERIPHMGWVSVAIIDTKTKFIVGEDLLTFETTSVSGYGTDDREVVVTIPKLYPKCLAPGECVLQWTWFARVVKQTYESCIDFTIALETYDVDGSDRDLGSDQKILEKEIAN